MMADDPLASLPRLAAAAASHSQLSRELRLATAGLRAAESALSALPQSGRVSLALLAGVLTELDAAAARGLLEAHRAAAAREAAAASAAFGSSAQRCQELRIPDWLMRGAEGMGEA